MPFPLPLCPWLPLFEYTLALLEYLLHVVFLGDWVQEPVIRQKKLETDRSSTFTHFSPMFHFYTP